MAQFSQNPYTVSPGNDYSQGLSGLSNTLENVRQAQMQQAEIQRRQEIQDRAEQRFQEVQSAAQEAFESQDPDKIARIAIKYPEVPQMLKAAVGLKDETQNRDASSFFSEFAAASPEGRQAVIERRAQTIKDRGGNPEHTLQMLEDFKANPEAESKHIINMWSGVNPTNYQAYAEDQKAIAKAALEKQKSDAEESRFQREEAGRNQRAYARAAATAGGSSAEKQTAHQKDFNQWKDMPGGPEKDAFGKAAGFVSKEGDVLSPVLQKRLSIASDVAVASENNASQYNSLADQIEQSGMKGGLAGSVSETLKDLTGSQDAVTELRKKAAQVKATQAVSNMPPGSASDKDVKIFMGPFPSENASKEYLASWLRGQAKVEKLNSDFNYFKADYISSTGGERDLLKVWKEQGKPGSRNPGASPGAASNSASPPVVTTQAQVDALPSGALFIEDGQQYRKP